MSRTINSGAGGFGALPKGVSAQQLEEVRLFNASLTSSKNNSPLKRGQRGSRGGSGAGRIATTSRAAGNPRGAHKGENSHVRSGSGNSYEYGRLTPYHFGSSSPSPISKKSNPPLAKRNFLRESSAFDSGPAVGYITTSGKGDWAGYQNQENFSGDARTGPNGANVSCGQSNQQWVPPHMREPFEVQSAAQTAQAAASEARNSHVSTSATTDTKPAVYHFGSPPCALPGLGNSIWSTQAENVNPMAGISTPAWNQHLNRVRPASGVSTSPWTPQLEPETFNAIDPFATPLQNYMDSSMIISWQGATSTYPVRHDNKISHLVDLSFDFDTTGNDHLFDFDIGNACGVEPLQPMKQSSFGSVPTAEPLLRSPLTLKDSRWAPGNVDSIRVAPATTFQTISAPPVVQVPIATHRSIPQIFVQSTDNVLRTAAPKPTVASPRQSVASKVSYLKDSSWAT